MKTKDQTLLEEAYLKMNNLEEHRTNNMKVIEYLDVDYTTKISLAELAKRFEGRDVSLIFEQDAWGDTHLVVVE
jgi:hypothetical protein